MTTSWDGHFIRWLNCHLGPPPTPYQKGLGPLNFLLPLTLGRSRWWREYCSACHPAAPGFNLTSLLWAFENSTSGWDFSLSHSHALSLLNKIFLKNRRFRRKKIFHNFISHIILLRMLREVMQKRKPPKKNLTFFPLPILSQLLSSNATSYCFLVIICLKSFK